MHILFLTNLLPYPLDNGGKIKTYTTLKALSNGNHDVDLLCFKEDEDSLPIEAKELAVCSSVKRVFQRLTTADNKKYMIMMAIKSLFSCLPLSSYKYISKEMQNEIDSRKSVEYSCIYYDHLPMFVYYPLCKKLWPNAKHILDEHNCEAMIMKRNAEMMSNPLKKKFMVYESRKVERFETKALLSADITIVLSKEDYINLSRIARKEFKYHIIPIGVQDKGVKHSNVNSGVLNILFVGTLTWEPNNQGLIWFLDNVIPLMDQEEIEYHFYVVGKNPSSDVLNRTKNNSNITVTGYVESVDEYYDLCDCTVVPLFIGSGQRVKLIEAFSKGMPAISTTIGAEGLKYKNNESLLIADNKDEFVKSIKAMQNACFRNKLGINARKLYEDHYSTNAVEKKILSVIGS